MQLVKCTVILSSNKNFNIFYNNVPATNHIYKIFHIISAEATHPSQDHRESNIKLHC